MVTDMNKLCDALRQERIERGINLTTVAEMANLDKSTLSKYEKGRLLPKPDTLDRWAGVFGYKVGFSLMKAIVEVQPGSSG